MNNELNNNEEIKNEESNNKESINGDMQSEFEIQSEKELKEQLTKIENELSDYKDKFIRKVAEFENFKRRKDLEIQNLFEYSSENFVKKLLSIIDDFERSLNHINDAKDVDSIKQGINFVYEKFIKLLNEQGVRKIDSVGKIFDVHYHEALMQTKVDGAEPHQIIDEVEKGYMYKDRVIRHSKVVVNEDVEIENSINNFDDVESNSGEKNKE